jgi:1,4-dihydroxy-2-naphthoate octaprenyltransferase
MHFFVFLGGLLPVIAYFIYWFIKTTGNESYADYDHAMRMTRLSACCMVLCYSILLWLNLSSGRLAII